MSQNPTVSVLMSVYNAGPYLAEAVESILAQTYRDFELLAVNDGSSDGSGAVLERFAQRDPRVRVLSQENRGLVRSLNRAGGEARGKYLARMDADDISEPHRFERQVAFLDAHPKVVVVGGAVNVFGAGKVCSGNYPRADREIRAYLENEAPFAHPAVMMRRDAWLAAGQYRTVFFHAEDYDLWFRMAEQGELANLSEVVLQYRHHQNQRSRSARDLATHALAAQKSARGRRETGKDPLDRAERITPDSVRELGVTEDDIQRRTVMIRLTMAYMQAWDGHLDAAMEILKMADEDIRSPWVRRECGFRISAAYARLYRLGGVRRLPQSACSAVKAIVQKLNWRFGPTPARST